MGRSPALFSIDAAVRQVHYIALTFTGVAAAIISTAAFQATGKPLPALALSLFRMGLIAIPAAALLTLVFHLGMLGVFLGLMIGNLSSLPIAYIWTKRHLKRLAPRAIADS